MRILDISRDLRYAPVFPGDPPPRREEICSLEAGAGCTLSQYTLSAHAGTHVDAPAHFLCGGKTIGELELSRFYGPCVVRRASGSIGEAEARILVQGRPERLLLAGELLLTPEGCLVLAQSGLLLLGVEGMTVGPVEKPGETHRILLDAEVAIVENLILEDVPEGEYILCAAPVKWGDSEGAPCRAVLLEKEGETWG